MNMNFMNMKHPGSSFRSVSHCDLRLSLQHRLWLKEIQCYTNSYFNEVESWLLLLSL